jgi:DNA invertase Pin-like site-specific DNA recombinase
MRMIDDARAGKLDMIITKSITRFARNTVDSLMYLRILKEYNVDVYFEVENVHSLEANEMLLTILSSVAQQSSEDKSESISGDIKGSLKKERFMLPICMAISQTEEHLILLKKKQKLFERSFLNIFQE